MVEKIPAFFAQVFPPPIIFFPQKFPQVFPHPSWPLPQPMVLQVMASSGGRCGGWVGGWAGGRAGGALGAERACGVQVTTGPCGPPHLYGASRGHVEFIGFGPSVGPYIGIRIWAVRLLLCELLLCQSTVFSLRQRAQSPQGPIRPNIGPYRNHRVNPKTENLKRHPNEIQRRPYTNLGRPKSPRQRPFKIRNQSPAKVFHFVSLFSPIVVKDSAT